MQEIGMYHAFLSYEHTDDGWVENELIPVVEEEWGLTVCIGRRDFEAGKPISENIVDAIDKSKKTILIITPGFVESSWCDFEMQMALTKGRQHIIIIYKEDVAIKKMSKTLRALMKSLNYIEYSEEHQELFWQRLHDSLMKHT